VLCAGGLSGRWVSFLKRRAISEDHATLNAGGYFISTKMPLRDILGGRMRMLRCFAFSLMFLLVCARGFSLTPQERFDQAVVALANAGSEEQRFYALGRAAKVSFEIGRMEDSRRYAVELQGLLPKFGDDWNYGNAVHDANLVLGRIALREGRIEEARKYLIQAGNSPGSPQLNIFGPNMSLAKDMLAKGEGETVLQYFELCRKFWKADDGQLDEWKNEVKAGRMPKFGANLSY
jgi:hypothetical protein